MKTRRLFISILIVVCLNAAYAGGKPLPPPANQPLAPNALPSSVLQPWLYWRLNNLLAPLDRPGLKHAEAAADLKGAIADAASKAPLEKKAAFQAAIALCNVLCQAADERQQAVANLQGAGAAQSSSSRRLGSKKDKKTDNAFFARAAENQWLQRSAQLRQQISQFYARERAIEAQIAAPPSAAAGVSDTITIQEPTTVQIKYSTATIPAGTTLRVVTRDTKGTVVEYSGELVTLPTQ